MIENGGEKRARRKTLTGLEFGRKEGEDWAWSRGRRGLGSGQQYSGRGGRCGGEAEAKGARVGVIKGARIAAIGSGQAKGMQAKKKQRWRSQSCTGGRGCGEPPGLRGGARLQATTRGELRDRAQEEGEVGTAQRRRGGGCRVLGCSGVAAADRAAAGDEG